MTIQNMIMIIIILKNIKKFVRDLLEYFWLPVLLLAVIVLLLSGLINKSGEQNFNIIFGIALGVTLGFLADIFKKSLDDFQDKRRMKKISLKLLKCDAERIYKTMWLYDSACKAENTPEDFKKAIKEQIPPALDLKYWGRLSQNNAFLLLGSEEPFSKIFEEMWDMEKINEFIFLAKQDNPQAKQAYVFAKVIYKTAVEEENHKELLLNFMSEEDIREMVKKWSEAAQERKNK